VKESRRGARDFTGVEGMCPRRDPAAGDDVEAGTGRVCESGYGAADMAGGHREWTCGKRGDRKIAMGGWSKEPERLATRCATRHDETESTALHNLSFRCCIEDEP